MPTDTETDIQVAHDLFHSWEGMEGLPARVAQPARPGLEAWPGVALTQQVYPGFLVAATIAVASTWLSQHYTAPVMLFALLFGMAFHFLHEEGRCVAGIEFSSKAVLRLGVALLGARITAAQILSLGLMPIATVIVAVLTTITFGFLVAKLLGQSRTFGVLSGGAVAICGASAALAIASVLPRDKDSERDTILTVVSITALSTAAMIVYPLIATGIGLTHAQSGIFLGGTIHDVAQVVGAGYTISPQTGDIATYVKLLRVTTLLPVVFVIAFIAQRGAGAVRGGSAPPIPLFLLGFAALVALNSFGFLAKPVTDIANDISRWCLVTAIAALGMKTSFKALLAVGWRPVALMVAETAWIGALVMTAVILFR
ncbi:MAG TPA: YeiH family protein [Caulobacteraceae bacterium]|nr:YeiH family protein [Caulobacteraceae bacterium]